jgi:hypothetical protein
LSVDQQKARNLTLICSAQGCKISIGAANEKSVASDLYRDNRGFTLRYHRRTIGCGTSDS